MLITSCEKNKRYHFIKTAKQPFKSNQIMSGNNAIVASKCAIRVVPEVF
jgi:hypothetical protein